jgi:hypothetical protein
MTHSDPFAYFEEVLHADCASLSPDAFSPPSEDPDFVLLDDADGRFVVDPRSGLICVASEDVLERDRGSVHSVRLETREAFGSRFVMTLRLKLTGLVPTMARDDEPTVFHAEAAPASPLSAPLLPWRDFAAFKAQDAVFPTPNCDAAFGEAVEAFGAVGWEAYFELDDAILALNASPPAPANDQAWM